MEHNWHVATIWMALALGASLISIRIGVSVALVEILMGMIGGNFLDLHTESWIDFLAGFGAVLLTFLAGAEIDPQSFRQHLKSSVAIGVLSFLLPFLGVWMFTYFVLDWDWRAAQIAGIALSTTSVAVVYAVMVETGLNETSLGKLILAACFVTDLGTVLALGICFANFNEWTFVFIGATIPALWLMPKAAPRVIKWWGNRVSLPEVKFFFLVLFLFAWLAMKAGSEAVLPAYLLGLVSAGTFMRERPELQRLRGVAFAALTPFYFLKAGLFISLEAIGAGIVTIIVLLLLKLGTKSLGVWPLTKVFGMRNREGMYTTLLMSTGLTFGSISALYGLTHEIISQDQYTILVTVVIGSAVVPTLIAQQWFRPRDVGSIPSPQAGTPAPDGAPGQIPKG